ncbi:DNA topoisomerase I [Altericista sp. CCNU0014]
MEHIEKILDALKHLARKVIEALFGPESEPELEMEPIPVPVRDRNFR